MARMLLMVALGLGLAAWPALSAEGSGKKEKKAAAKKEKKKDPLARFKDEQLADVGFCFQAFCAAVAKKETALVKAFLFEVPKNLARLDLKKPAGRKAFLKAFAVFQGARIVKHQRVAIGGLAVVTYAGAKGKQKEQRMKNVGGRWKIVLD